MYNIYVLNKKVELFFITEAMLINAYISILFQGIDSNHIDAGLFSRHTV